MTLTPHRDAAEIALARMRTQVASLPPGRPAANAAMSMAVMDAVLPRVADMADRGESQDEAQSTVVVAIANLLTSLAVSLRKGNPASGHDLFHTLVADIDRQGCISLSRPGPDLHVAQPIVRPAEGHA